MDTIGIIFYAGLTLAIIGTALGMLFNRNAVYSAIFLVLNLTMVAVLYLTLGAPFIAMAQVTVYAGAIMVLFLFVIMLLGAEKLVVKEPLQGQRLIAILLGVAILAQAAALIITQLDNVSPLDIPGPEFASPSAIGTVMFKNYSLPFLVIAFILLTSAVGAVVLTRPGRSALRKQAEEKKELEHPGGGN
jgi:NADH-quinone oxidoreductase subunit J